MDISTDNGQGGAITNGGASDVDGSAGVGSVGFEPIDKPPAHLNEEAGEIFSKIVRALAPYKLVEEPDRIALAQLAGLLEESRRLTEKINKMGHTYTRQTAMGDEIHLINPALVAREKVAGRAWSIMRSFGMTPASRRKVEDGDAGEQSDWLNEFGI